MEQVQMNQLSDDLTGARIEVQRRSGLDDWTPVRMVSVKTKAALRAQMTKAATPAQPQVRAVIDGDVYVIA
jgi:hypothetical protein